MLQITLLIQFFLTLSFGLSSSLPYTLLFRCCIGLFAPGYALARPLLSEVLDKDKDKLPAGSILSAAVFALMQPAGLLLGTVMVGNQDLPYLEPSLINVILLLFSFVIVSTDFPPPKTSTPSTNAPTPPVPAKEQFHKFVSEANSEDHKEEDEVPSYLQPFASPNFPKLQVLKGLFTEDAEDPQGLTLDSQVREAEEGQPHPNVKRTHISFVDEEIKDVENTTDQSISDPFQMENKSETLRNSGFLGSLLLYLAVISLESGLEYSSIYWLSSEIAPKDLGVLLCLTALFTACLPSLIIHKTVNSVSFNCLAVGMALLATLASAAFPFILYTELPLVEYGLVVLVGGARNVAFSVLSTVLVLRLSDRITVSTRSKALSLADITGSLTRSLSIILSPVCFSLFTQYFPVGFALISGLVSGVVMVGMGITRKYYQRLDVAPYRV